MSAAAGLREARADVRTVRSPDDVRDFLSSVERGRRPRSVVNELPGPDGLAPGQTQERLDRLLSACGCEAGAVGGWCALAACAAWLWGQGTTSWPVWASVLVLGFVAGAGIGKGIGLWRARRRLLRFLRTWAATTG